MFINPILFTGSKGEPELPDIPGSFHWRGDNLYVQNDYIHKKTHLPDRYIWVDKDTWDNGDQSTVLYPYIEYSPNSTITSDDISKSLNVIGNTYADNPSIRIRPVPKYEKEFFLSSKGGFSCAVRQGIFFNEIAQAGIPKPGQESSFLDYNLFELRTIKDDSLLHWVSFEQYTSNVIYIRMHSMVDGVEVVSKANKPVTMSLDPFVQYNYVLKITDTFASLDVFSQGNENLSTVRNDFPKQKTPPPQYLDMMVLPKIWFRPLKTFINSVTLYNAV